MGKEGNRKEATWLRGQGVWGPGCRMVVTLWGQWGTGYAGSEALLPLLCPRQHGPRGEALALHFQGSAWHREGPSFAELKRAHRLGWPPALLNSIYVKVFSAQVHTGKH